MGELPQVAQNIINWIVIIVACIVMLACVIAPFYIKAPPCVPKHPLEDELKKVTSDIDELAVEIAVLVETIKEMRAKDESV